MGVQNCEPSSQFSAIGRRIALPRKLVILRAVSRARAVISARVGSKDLAFDLISTRSFGPTRKLKKALARFTALRMTTVFMVKFWRTCSQKNLLQQSFHRRIRLIQCRVQLCRIFA